MNLTKKETQKIKNLVESMRDILCLTSEQTSCRSCCVLELLCDTKEMLTVAELRKSGQNFGWYEFDTICCLLYVSCMVLQKVTLSTFWTSTTYLSCHLSEIAVIDSDKVVMQIYADLRQKREHQGGLD